MAGTVVSVFEDHQAAEKAAQKLVDAGVQFGDISLVCNHAGGATGDTDVDRNHPWEDEEEFISHGFREVPHHDVEQVTNIHEERTPRMITGVIAGMPLGALLVASTVIIPQLGDLVTSAPLAAMMTGAIAGGVIGGVVGSAAAGGIPVDAATFYHEQVAKGATLVAVLVGKDNVHSVSARLEQLGGHDVRFFARLIDSLQSVES
jgi:hypothetical protein